jgi:uncharacterized membrane-anchored protein YjiN (DUF445 family)
MADFCGLIRLESVRNPFGIRMPETGLIPENCDFIIRDSSIMSGARFLQRDFFSRGRMRRHPAGSSIS